MRVTKKLKALIAAGDPPFDRTGLVCLAWTGVFVALSMVLVLILK
jgi:hypothetical protein